MEKSSHLKSTSAVNISVTCGFISIHDVSTHYSLNVVQVFFLSNQNCRFSHRHPWVVSQTSLNSVSKEPFSGMDELRQSLRSRKQTEKLGSKLSGESLAQPPVAPRCSVCTSDAVWKVLTVA